MSAAGTVYTGSATNDNQQRHFWMPSLITNGLQKIILGCSAAGPQAFINAIATQLNLNGGFTSPYFYTNTPWAYNPPGDPGGSGGRRWGDYSHVSVDPLDDMTIWLVNEFCNATNSYGVQVASIPAPGPASLISICPNPISVNVASTSLTIRGKSVNGTGFFDPGPSFSNRLQVSIEDVQVLTTTYVSPTQIDLTVSTVGTTTGYKDVTVTNPDGQSVKGSSMLNVVP